jgi:hypothetical protein
MKNTARGITRDPSKPRNSLVPGPVFASSGNEATTGRYECPDRHANPDRIESLPRHFDDCAALGGEAVTVAFVEAPARRPGKRRFVFARDNNRLNADIITAGPWMSSLTG